MNDYDRLRTWRKRGMHDMTVEKYEAMKIAQAYKCAICGADIHVHAYVDHMHEIGKYVPGKVRSLLCNRCNLLEGQLNNVTENGNTLLDALIEYKAKYEGKEV